MKKSMRKIAIAAMACALFLPTLTVGVAKTMENAGAEHVIVEETATAAAVLRQGATGGEVKEVQRRLKLWGYYNGSVDGVFGAGTKKAVIAFQKKNGLTADGVVGKSNYKARGMNSS
jgi:N-acetylmuramoyl-L-alanine amidase